MKNLLYLILIIGLSLFNSCDSIHDNDSPNRIFKSFPKTEKLYSQEIIISKETSSMGDIVIKDSILIMKNSYDRSEKLFHFFHKNSLLYLGATGRTGKGPGEYNGARLVESIGKSDDLHILDLNNRKLFFLNIDSILKNPVYIPYKKTSTSIQLEETRIVRASDILIETQLSDSTFLAYLYPAFENRFVIVNDDMEVIHLFGEFPPMENKGIPKDPFLVHFLSNFYQRGTLQVNKELGKMAFSHSYMDLIEVYDLQSKLKLINIIGPDVNFPPDYQIVGNGNWKNSSPCKSCKAGYSTIVSSAKYIYALYSDKLFYDRSKSLAKYLFQFDWDGNPICKYELDSEVSTIAYDEETNRLFALNPLLTNSILVFNLN